MAKATLDQLSILCCHPKGNPSQSPGQRQRQSQSLRPWAFTGAELDQHFGLPIHEAVEEVNNYFQSRLFSILAGPK
jgi:hypothetical protein